MRTAIAAAMTDSGRPRHTTTVAAARQPSNWATRIQSGIDPVVTPNRASTESGATLTVGRNAFNESGAPMTNGNQATAATAPASTGARKSRGRVANVNGKKMTPHGLQATARPRASAALSGLPARIWYSATTAHVRVMASSRCP